ncbi:MAG: DUF2961 domain-containing protein [Bryobacteraceae bacterium]
MLRSFVILLCLCPLAAQDLTRPQTFEARRTSSTNPDVRSNDDAKRPIPGETIVLADLTGPGVVTHIWITGSNTEYGWPRLFRMRIFYDGNATPSVDVPLGDFFGSGHGLERNLNSQMVRVSSSGRSRNSYWQMPFHRRCRITVTNEGTRRPNSFYYQVDWKKVAALPADTLYFHALYQQAVPAQPGELYQLLDVRGSGHYAGTVFSVVQTQPGWFGEGDEHFFVDGAGKASLQGTGTEDYFGDAYALHVSEGAYSGTTVAEGTGTGARMTAYRWHVTDPIPFRRSLRFGFEHAGFVLNADGGVKATFDERADFFSSVAFWYQRGIASGLPVPPYGTRRLPHGNARSISVGPGLDVLFSVDHEGRYELLLRHATGPALSRYSVSLDDNELTAIIGRDDEPERPRPVLVDGHAPEAGQREQVLAWVDLSPGTHRLRFRPTDIENGKLGINGLIVSEVGRIAPEPPDALRYRRAGLERTGSLAELTHGLRHSDAEVRAAAAWALGQWGKRATEALPALSRALEDSDATVRGLAAVALRELGASGGAAVPALIRALKDQDSNVRMIGAVTLGRWKAASAVPALIEVASNPAEELAVLRNVVAAFGEIGPSAKAALPVLEALKANPRLRYPASAAQTKIQSPR